MDKEELESKYHELRSCKAVAEYYGTSEETIRRRLIAFDIPRVGWKVPKRSSHAKNRPLTKDQIQEIIDTYKQTGNELDTCRITHRSPCTITKYLKVAGIAPGTGGNQARQRKITDEQILEAVKTMTRHEIADKYGVHVENLARRMKKLGVHAVYDTSIKDKADTWHYSKAYDDLIKKIQPGFEFVSSRHRKCRLRCKTCGVVIERDLSTIRGEHVRCDACYQQERELLQKSQSLAKLLKVLSAVEEKKRPKVCPCCGGTFYSQYSSAKWCPRCRKTRGNYSRRAKKFGVEYEHGISLRKVFMRDKGVCQICGEPTDWHDNRWNGYIGPLYPTVDHIIALANGGKHTWDNVQLAHAMCNSVKGANR